MSVISGYIYPARVAGLAYNDCMFPYVPNLSVVIVQKARSVKVERPSLTTPLKLFLRRRLFGRDNSACSHLTSLPYTIGFREKTVWKA